MNNKKRIINLLVGPALFVLSLAFLPHNIFSEISARAAVGTVSWMAYWWITAPVDFAVTAFLPIAVNAFVHMADMSAVISNYPLSFEATDYENNDDSSWLQSNESLEEEQDAKDLEERFMKLLTGYQKEVFLFVLKNGESQIDFAKRKGVTSQSVRNVIRKIQEKAKKFFD